MSFFNKLKLVFAYGSELEELLKNIKKEKSDEEFKRKLHHINLCLKHQQEERRSHYSEHNCHHCKLIKENEKMKMKMKRRLMERSHKDNL